MENNNTENPFSRAYRHIAGAVDSIREARFRSASDTRAVCRMIIDLLEGMQPALERLSRSQAEPPAARRNATSRPFGNLAKESYGVD